MEHRKYWVLVALVAILALVLAACGTEDATDETAEPADETDEPTGAEEPAEGEDEPADAGGDAVEIALVRQLGAGDYFEQYQAGAVAEAERLGVELRLYNAEGDNAQHALDIESAVDRGVDAIAVDHGFPETVQPAIVGALDAGIPVVAFDVDAGDERVPQIEQNDHRMAELALDELVADTGGEGDVLYVYVAGFAPLDRRNEVWEQVKGDNPGLNQVAQIGVVDDNIVAGVADQAKAALQANPDTVAAFAPFNEFAKGVVLALEELGMTDQVKVYGADISTADIGVMTEVGSPWVATATTDPYNVGAVTIRAAYLLAIGEDVPADIYVEPLLITQQELLDAGVTNMDELREAFPALQTPDLLPAG